MNLIQIYAPTADKKDDDKIESFYEDKRNVHFDYCNIIFLYDQIIQKTEKIKNILVHDHL